MGLFKTWTLFGAMFSTKDEVFELWIMGIGIVGRRSKEFPVTGITGKIGRVSKTGGTVVHPRVSGVVEPVLTPDICPAVATTVLTPDIEMLPSGSGADGFQ